MARDRKRWNVRVARLGEVREMSGLSDIADLDEPLVSVAGRKGVVVLVHRKERANAPIVVEVEALTDLIFSTRRKTVRRRQKAIEQVGGLDAQNNGQFARLHHFARFGG
jgi:hypothetical protein